MPSSSSNSSPRTTPPPSPRCSLSHSSSSSSSTCASSSATSTSSPPPSIPFCIPLSTHPSLRCLPSLDTPPSAPSCSPTACTSRQPTAARSPSACHSQAGAKHACLRRTAARLLLLAIPTVAANQCTPEAACEPVVLVPGIMGSRLRQHRRMPGSLETVSQHLWLPESHKLMMRSAILGPVSSSGYWSWVNSLNPLYSIPGARVEPDRTNWGVKGVACILKAGRECVSGAKVFWDMVVSLERAGYRAGTNLYGVPFDWRLLPNENKLCADLARVLHRITNTTSHRKALLVSHSMGNLQILYCMQRVFGVETLAKIKALVSLAPPWAGAPQLARVMTSGAEMVSKVIITNAETRDFTRQLSGPYMLLPDERLWGNSTLMTFRAGERHDTVSSAARAVWNGTAHVAPADHAEEYKGSRKGLKALFRKIEAHAPHVSSGMQGMYERSLQLIDIWSAPPVPVVCVIGSGKPTVVHFGYCESWPHVFNEEPCALRYEDGDITVPRRSAESVCRAWQRQQRCHSTLSSVHKARYRGRDDDCVDVVLMHCRAPNMESLGVPRGANHCDDYHQRILHKVPTIDLVHEIATNVHAYEPSYSAALEQLHELSHDVTWLHNSAARRLPHVDKLALALRTSAGGGSRAEGLPWEHDEEVPALVQQLQRAWATLKRREQYEQVLGSLDAIRAAVRRAEQVTAVVQRSAIDEGFEAEPQLDGGAVRSELDARLGQAEEAVRPLARAMQEAWHAWRVFEGSCNRTHLPKEKRGWASFWGRRAEEQPQQQSSAARPPRADECTAGPALEWSTVDATTSGLPDCPSVFEAASHRYIRQSVHESRAARRRREARRQWKCAIHRAISIYTPALDQLRRQLEWNLHHWKLLAERLRRPPQAQSGSAERMNVPYTSALYGKMQDIEMDVSHGR